MLACATIRALEVKDVVASRPMAGHLRRPMSVKKFSRIIITGGLFALFVSATFFVPQVRAQQPKEPQKEPQKEQQKEPQKELTKGQQK
jgi:hypothetical protein